MPSPRRLRSALSPLFAAALAVAAGRRAAAQAPSVPVDIGDRVQFAVVDSAAGSALRRCHGRVTALAGDTIVVGRAGRCPRRSYGVTIPPLRVARGSRGSRLGHTVVGVLGGALVGGVAGRLAAGTGCRSGGACGSDAGYAAGVLTMVGVYAGALGGGVVGLLLPAGPRWVSAGGAPPLRVTGDLPARPPAAETP